LKKEKAKGEIGDWKNAFVQKRRQTIVIGKTYFFDAGSEDLVFQLKKKSKFCNHYYF
jgi:alanyl-tRNA synthetase